MDDPDFRMAMRIEGGPEAAGALGMAEEAIERYGSSGNRYTTLHETFGPRDDGTDPFDGWDSDNLAEFLRLNLGIAEQFAGQYESMDEQERAERFPDPAVAELVARWAQYGRSLMEP